MKKIFSNSLWLSGSQLVSRLIGFLYFVFLARNFAVEEFGILAWVLGFVYNFYPVADFGIERLVLKKVSRKVEKSKEYLEKLLPLRFIFAIFTSFLAFFLSWLATASIQKALLVLIFALALIPYNILSLLTAIENSKENMSFYAKVNFSTSFLTAFLGVVFVKFGFGLPLVLFSYFLGNLTVLILGVKKTAVISCLLGKIKQIGKEDVLFWREILKESWVFAAIFILAVFYLRIALILVGLLLGDYWAGIYGAPAKFLEAGILIPQSIVLALFPISSRLFVEDKSRLKGVYFKSLALLAVLGATGGLAMFLGGNFFIPLIYGKEYLLSAKIFSLMGFLAALLSVNVLPGNVIQNSDQVKKFLPFSLVNFLVALVACWMLIKKLGVVGGVYGMIAGEIFGLAINNWFVFRILNSKS